MNFARFQAFEFYLKQLKIEQGHMALSYLSVPFRLDHKYGPSDFKMIGHTRLIRTPSLSESIGAAGLGSDRRTEREREREKGLTGGLGFWSPAMSLRLRHG
jgi:hypothetical protein